MQASPSTNAHGGDTPEWIEPVARFGYATKGLVYAVVGGLAIRQALGSGDVGGTSEALRQIASGPFGTVLLAVTAVGLAGYVLWRLVQAVLDPEAGASDDGSALRWGKRAFYLVSAAAYGLLAYEAASLVLGTSGGSGGDSSQTWTARLMSMRWGVWLVGIVGAGIVGRAVLQFVKAWTSSFAKRLQAYELSAVQRRWVLRTSRAGLVARGVVFALIGGSVVEAALTHDPNQARGLEGVLEMFLTNSWLMGAIGIGLVAYAVYQWVKARYRLVGLP